MAELNLDIDWSLTTWEGNRRAQLRRALSITLRERMQAVEDMAEIARRFEETRANGKMWTISQVVSGESVRDISCRP